MSYECSCGMTGNFEEVCAHIDSIPLATEPLKSAPAVVNPPRLFLGLEETNMQDFISPCCKAPLSLEPLCRIACGNCGKTVKEEDAIFEVAG